MLIISSCGHQWARQLIPCPDGREGCLVLHYDDFEKDRFCPECGHDVRQDFKDPLMLHEKVGTAVINTNAISKLKLT